MLDANFWAGIIFLAAVALTTAAYFLRMRRRGPARFDRVDQQGSSKFLGRGLQEMGYWALQPLGSLCVALRLSPNQISWLSFFLGLAAAVALGRGSFGYGSWLMALALLLDTIDGMVARRLGVASDAGEVLDAAIDRYVEFFFFAGLAYNYRFASLLQGLVSLALLGSFMVSYTTAKAEALHIKLPKGGLRRPERAVYLMLGTLLTSLSLPFEPIGDFGFALGYPMIAALVVVAVFANVTSVKRFIFMMTELRARDIATRVNGGLS